MQSALHNASHLSHDRGARVATGPAPQQPRVPITRGCFVEKPLGHEQVTSRAAAASYTLYADVKTNRSPLCSPEIYLRLLDALVPFGVQL